MEVGDKVRLNAPLVLNATLRELPKGSEGFIKEYAQVAKLYRIRFKTMGYLVYVDPGLLELVT